MRAWLGFLLCTLLICCGCSGSTATETTAVLQGVPQGVGGTWNFTIGEFACDVPPGILDDFADETFLVVQNTDGSFSANFTDSGGNSVALFGTLDADGIVSGFIDVTVPGSRLTGTPPCAGKVYVTGLGAGLRGVVNVIDMSQGTPGSIVKTIDVGSDQLGEPCFAPNGALLFVPSPNDNEVAVIDTANDTILATLSGPEFEEPTSCAVSADGNTLYVVNAHIGTPIITEASTVTVVDIDLDFGPFSVLTTITGGSTEALGAVISPDGNLLAAFSPTGNSVQTYDLVNELFEDELFLSIGPRAGAFVDDQTLVVVGDQGSVILDPTNLSATGSSLPLKGWDIEIEPTGRYAYVTAGPFDQFNPNDFVFSVLDLQQGGAVVGGFDTSFNDGYGVALCQGGRTPLWIDGITMHVMDALDPENPTQDSELLASGETRFVKAGENAARSPARTIQVGFFGLAIETQLGIMIDGPIRIVSDTDGTCTGRATGLWVSVREDN